MLQLAFERFVAWRYLRSHTRGGRVAIPIGLVLFIIAAIGFWLAHKKPPLYPGEPGIDWHQVWLYTGIGSLAVGVWFCVFGIFHVLMSFFTTISTFGVYMGTQALIVVLSVMNGFEVDLRQKILGSNAHIQITKEDGAFTEYRDVMQKVKGLCAGGSCVVGATPYVQSEVVVSANSNYNAVIIKGIDPDTVAQVTDLKKNVEHKSAIQRLWPILPDGGVARWQVGNAPDAGVEGDGGVPDFSGDGSLGAAPAIPPGATGHDVLDEPVPDFSGGGVTASQPTSHPSLHDLDGIDLNPDIVEVGKTPRLRDLEKRTNGLDGILVGRELAKNLHLFDGEEVQVVSPIGQDTPTGQIPKVRSYRVAGLFYTGMYEYDVKYVYVSMPSLQQFLSLGDEATGVEVKISNIDKTDGLVDELSHRLGKGYRVQDWKELNRSLFSALKLEKIAMFIVLAIIILVASFSIISNLIMVVVEKAREIAILKSMGAPNLGVLLIFVFEGLYIGLLGTGFGISLGLACCWGLKQFGLPLNSEVYYISKLPVAVDPMAVAMVAFAGVFFSGVATLYPAWIGARLRPVEGLRYQ